MNDRNAMISARRSSGISSAGTSSLTGLDLSLFNDDVNDLANGTTTPFEANPPELPWYKHVLSEWNAAWNECGDLWRTGGYQNKLYTIVFFLCLPACVIKRAASPERNITVPDHVSVGYLFLLMCYTFVINLFDFQTDLQVRYIFIASCMVLAIAAMLYVYLFTKGRVRHDPCHDAPIRIFFRGGLYIFGFASMFNSICLVVYEWECKAHNHKSAATVLAVKGLFIVTETLFLGYFHKACLPLDTALLQISLAHILGTNLALWFWTLCEENRGEFTSNSTTNCSTLISSWVDYQQIFYPIFVEYLILALAILYGLWTNLRRDEQKGLCRFCKNCTRCLYRSQVRVNEEKNDEVSSTNVRQYVPRCGVGITIGSIYVTVFLAIMLLAILKAKELSGGEMSLLHAIADNSFEAHNITKARYAESEGTFIAYCYCAVVMYLSMISSCYIILASLRSPNHSHRIRSIDYDDVLLYISLMGILLLEGFHVVSKIKTGQTGFHVLAVDITGTVQHLTQAVTLMSLSHYRGTASRLNKTWICECILFLFLTNIAWWIEDSFFLQPIMTRPGELATFPGLKPYGRIVKPMVIFFRFHSATYFYNAWTIYKN